MLAKCFLDNTLLKSKLLRIWVEGCITFSIFENVMHFPSYEKFSHLIHGLVHLTFSPSNTPCLLQRDEGKNELERTTHLHVQHRDLFQPAATAQQDVFITKNGCNYYQAKVSFVCHHMRDPNLFM